MIGSGADAVQAGEDLGAVGVPQGEVVGAVQVFDFEVLADDPGDSFGFDFARLPVGAVGAGLVEQLVGDFVYQGFGSGLAGEVDLAAARDSLGFAGQLFAIDGDTLTLGELDQAVLQLQPAGGGFPVGRRGQGLAIGLGDVEHIDDAEALQLLGGVVFVGVGFVDAGGEDRDAVLAATDEAV